ncbi:LD-carboxypeptidase [Flavihumibacter stibioxidans]|uniref:LD-carboxypeptidase n=1 Tax=Flavihumibacter stibioxidans TaxID=1834163 RepID=A0ABR7M6T7_9BACT|nr:LD-carboxypeptidase [Flavihumibacter stibioxidans]MBC6490725.1 LD-carboxypeptidase [Flavihumibacter stibioxidans]
MQRKDFIKQGLAVSLGLPLAGAVPATGNRLPAEEESLLIKIPPCLNPGDTIGITSPAGYITAEEIRPAVEQMESWGLRIRIGDTIGKRDGTFGGTDAERAADLQKMLDDRTIKAVMCARGGYGMVRIIDQVDFGHFRRHPKWLIGFSDVTVLHAHLSRHARVASIHSKMCNSFPDDWTKADALQQETILSIRNMLFGEKMRFEIPSHAENRSGLAVGELIGGNCKTIESITGSASDIKTGGKILFLEDTGEYLYSIDRMFWNLKRSGKLENLAGLVIGGFKIKPAENPEEEFNKNLYQIVLEKISDCNYPVCFDFPVGHQKNNYALKCGANVRLSVSGATTVLEEIH